MAARNMKRIEINIHEKLCVKLVIYEDSVSFVTNSTEPRRSKKNLFVTGDEVYERKVKHRSHF